MSVISPDQLDAIASEMNAMKLESDATISFDLLADALQWSDEVPDFGGRRPRDFWCLRPVLRYRTTLILGAPEEDLADYWREAQRRIPEWPGFHPSRCREDASLADLYHQLRAEGMASVDLHGRTAPKAGVTDNN